MQKVAVNHGEGFTQEWRELANGFAYSNLHGGSGYGTSAGNGSLLAPSREWPVASPRSTSRFGCAFSKSDGVKVPPFVLAYSVSTAV